MAKVPGVKLPKMPGVKMPKVPGSPGPVKGIKPISAMGQTKSATAGIEEDRIVNKVKRPVRTRVPRVV